MSEKTLFQLPTDPEQFSVLLPPADLRRLDFSALEFETARRAVVEYIKTYFPDDFNDFVTNNGIIMLIENLAYLTAILSLRSDILVNEAFLPTSRTEDAVINHLALIDQKLKPATPATVDIECSIETPLAADIKISPRSVFPLDVRGEDAKTISYEVFSAPDDLNSEIIIPAGKRAVIAFGLEGRTLNASFASDGTPNQQLNISNRNILGDPIKVSVALGSSVEEWTKVDILEKSLASDQVFEARILEGRLVIVFGDNITGKIPAAGSSITVTYRTGGGIRGRVGAGVIDIQRPVIPDYPYTAPVLVRFKNVTASSGGNDRESIDQAKKRAPRDFATQKAAVTESDYAQLAGSFSHPAFGTITKAVATVRTGLNANLVEVYALAEGPDNSPIHPSQGLKKALAAYLDEINVITDSVEVKNGAIRPVDIKMTVVMSRNADASVVKLKVQEAIADFFKLEDWDMGEPLYVSQIYERVNKLDGVSYVDIFEPADNILPTNKLADESGTATTNVSSGVGIDEVITLGDQQIDYYYEGSR